MIADPFGKPLDIGVRVAYNLSGQVCIGIVTKIRKTKSSPWTGKANYIVEVDRESQFTHEWNDRVSKHSKVKSENVCVI